VHEQKQLVGYLIARNTSSNFNHRLYAYMRNWQYFHFRSELCDNRRSQRRRFHLRWLKLLVIWQHTSVDFISYFHCACADTAIFLSCRWQFRHHHLISL